MAGAANCDLPVKHWCLLGACPSFERQKAVSDSVVHLWAWHSTASSDERRQANNSRPHVRVVMRSAVQEVE